jgi:hypothetical protein
MKKTLIGILSAVGILALLPPLTLGAYGMMGYGGTGGGIGVLWGLLGTVWFAIAVFVFSVIFWITYKWIVKNEMKKEK